MQGLQTDCLISNNGNYMYLYDKMPPDVRLRLQLSSYNLCAACVNDKSMACGSYHLAIDEMENKIKSKESVNALSFRPLTK